MNQTIKTVDIVNPDSSITRTTTMVQIIPASIYKQEIQNKINQRADLDSDIVKAQAIATQIDTMPSTVNVASLPDDAIKT